MSRTHDITISAFDLDRIESELAAVTEQRDRLADQIEANHKGTLVLERMVYQLREQRDRLAEALRELCETLLNDKPRDITESLYKAGDALAAAKGDKP
jgi:predicted  nucleic acid-binding Zn-ribbon protein